MRIGSLTRRDLKNKDKIKHYFILMNNPNKGFSIQCWDFINWKLIINLKYQRKTLFLFANWRKALKKCNIDRALSIHLKVESLWNQINRINPSYLKLLWKIQSLYLWGCKMGLLLNLQQEELWKIFWERRKPTLISIWDTKSETFPKIKRISK